MLSTCVECGGPIEHMRGPVEWDVKGESITVPDVEHGMCEACGEVYFADGASRSVHRWAVDAYKNKHGLLSGQEVREIRTSLGLSQAKFEQLIGAGPKTVVRWENGSVFQNRTADTLMRVLRAHPDIAVELMDGVERM